MFCGDRVWFLLSGDNYLVMYKSSRNKQNEILCTPEAPVASKRSFFFVVTPGAHWASETLKLLGPHQLFFLTKPPHYGGQKFGN